MFLSAFIFAAAIPLSAHASLPRCERPWVYFDLGNTIIDTRELDKKGGKAELRFMPGATKYLSELKEKGTPVGVISNVPESWGKTLASKLKHLKTFVQDHWRGAEKVHWSEFDAGILLPPTDKERKPSLYLFEKAIERAKSAGCPAVYIGEDEKEVEAARKAGLFAYQAGRQGKSFFLPEKELKEILSAPVSTQASGQTSGQASPAASVE